MNTTALRIEILIIGFQASIWGVLLSGLTPNEFLSEIVKLKDVSAFATVLLLGWCYSFGAAIDGFTGALEDPKSLFRRITGKKLSSSILWLKYPDASKELTQSYYDLRLLRSTSFNLLLLAIVSFFINQFIVISIVSLSASLLVGLSWYRRKKRIKDRKERLCEMASKLIDV